VRAVRDHVLLTRLHHEREAAAAPGFNWASLTVATVHIASQVADHFFNDRYNEAWAVGKAFGDQIHAAENAYWQAQGK